MARSPRTSQTPAVGGDKAIWQRTAHTWLQQANKGILNCTGTCTLDANANSTTISDTRIGVNSYINFMPLTGNAAIEKSRLVIEGQTNGLVVIGHSNNDVPDRIYTYCIMGDGYNISHVGAAILDSLITTTGYALLTEAEQRIKRNR